MRVVGVARDTKMFALRGERVPVVYAPVTQTVTVPQSVVVNNTSGYYVSVSNTPSATQVANGAAPGVPGHLHHSRDEQQHGNDAFHGHVTQDTPGCLQGG